MKFTPFKLNVFVLLKIPSAFLSGVRVKSIKEKEVEIRVKHRWINQNPFKSMYWATQGMASELATGLLVIQQIELSGKKISMLVTEQKGVFVKKAKGVIVFNCKETGEINAAIKEAITTKEGQTFELSSKGIDETGAVVSEFTYQWSVKVKQN